MRSVSRQYTELSDADIDIVLWVVICYVPKIGTHVTTNTELLRERATVRTC